MTLQVIKSGNKKPITFHKGGLHESLNVPQDETIPQDKIDAAKAGAYGDKAKKQALFMKNFLKGKR